jgi:hypothetical protein
MHKNQQTTQIDIDKFSIHIEKDSTFTPEFHNQIRSKKDHRCSEKGTYLIHLTTFGLGGQCECDPGYKGLQCESLIY